MAAAAADWYNRRAQVTRDSNASRAVLSLACALERGRAGGGRGRGRFSLS